MVIANETITQPENPPSHWGMELRARKAKDYLKSAVIAAVFFPLLFIGVNPGWFGTNFAGDGQVAGGIGAAIAGFILLSSFNDPGGRKRNAVHEAQNHFHDWHDNVLIPFLESKYGIEFAAVPLRSHYRRQAYKNGRSLTVHFNGISFERNNFGGDLMTSYFRSVTMGREIWLEEVIDPRKVQYKVMEPV